MALMIIIYNDRQRGTKIIHRRIGIYVIFNFQSSVYFI